MTSVVSRSVLRTDCYDIRIDVQEESVERVETRGINESRLTDDTLEDFLCSSKSRLSFSAPR
jgi:post-segregation antitoxin (ccd killing protein)